MAPTISTRSAPPRDSCCSHFGLLDQLLHGMSKRRGQLLEAQLLSCLLSVRDETLFHFAELSPPVHCQDIFQVVAGVLFVITLLVPLDRLVTLKPRCQRWARGYTGTEDNFGLVPELLRDNLILRAVFQLVTTAIVEQRNHTVPQAATLMVDVVIIACPVVRGIVVRYSHPDSNSSPSSVKKIPSAIMVASCATFELSFFDASSKNIIPPSRRSGEWAQLPSRSNSDSSSCSTPTTFPSVISMWHS